MEAFFEFEKPIANLEKKIQDLRELAKQEGVDFTDEIATLERKMANLVDETFAKLTPWQKVQLSRHPSRPYTRDYVDLLFPDFMELHGDRAFGDDQAMLAGVATWPPTKPGESGKPASEDKKFPILILGHQKGRNTKQKMERNFAMARPEGYRKAIRLMQMADRLKMPVLCFIDTPGAYPGLDAEERGQSQAIAQSIEVMFGLNVPTMGIVIGEGGSGGALAVGVTNTLLMMEYSYYSVIAPESCAAILWSDSSLAERASEKLKMSPPELLRMGVIDGIIPEPKGGAHRDWNKAAGAIHSALEEHLGKMIVQMNKKSSAKTPKQFQEARAEKFRHMGDLALAHAPVTAGT
jgi:acetyl-CoA carboxylase carboxyl transferase subunit alpha